MQFVIIPLIGLSIVIGYTKDDTSFTKSMGLTLLIIALSPSYSNNLLCSVFQADVESSEAMAFVSTILSLSTLPINFIVYSRIA